MDEKRGRSFAEFQGASFGHAFVTFALHSTVLKGDGSLEDAQEVILSAIKNADRIIALELDRTLIFPDFANEDLAIIRQEFVAVLTQQLSSFEQLTESLIELGLLSASGVNPRERGMPGSCHVSSRDRPWNGELNSSTHSQEKVKTNDDHP